MDNSGRNAPYVAASQNSVRVLPANYNTGLSPAEELEFRTWLTQNRVPFNPNAATSDYDMRGYWRALQQGDPRARGSAVNQNDNQLHYPDTWKTPLHQTFSEESQWAGPVAPKWTSDDKLIAPSGRILTDERAAPQAPLSRLREINVE